MNIVRRVLSPDLIKNSIHLTIGREGVPEPIKRTPKLSETSRHNDSYIIATQHGKEKISLDPKINRSQSLKALQYLNQQNSDESVIYKGRVFHNVLWVFPMNLLLQTLKYKPLEKIIHWKMMILIVRLVLIESRPVDKVFLKSGNRRARCHPH